MIGYQVQLENKGLKAEMGGPGENQMTSLDENEEESRQGRGKVEVIL